MHKIPLNKALLWILGSTLLISGTAFMGWLYYLHNKERRLQDDQYKIAAIVQSTAQSDSLKTNYLAEVLGLSIDKPINLYQFNAYEGEKSLLANPLIKEVSIKKILPGALLIHYEMRTPIAYLGEYTNTFLDKEGVLFPFRPFFTPKRLPILHLGTGDWKWGYSLKNEPALKLATSILTQFDQLRQDKFLIKQLDVSHAFADSYGQRQVILVLEEKGSDWNSNSPPIYLRLNPEDFQQGLNNFQTLQTKLLENKQEIEWVDLRISHLAFIKRKN